MGDIFSTRCELSNSYSLSLSGGDKSERIAVGELIEPASRAIACLAIDKRDALYLFNLPIFKGFQDFYSSAEIILW